MFSMGTKVEERCRHQLMKRAELRADIRTSTVSAFCKQGYLLVDKNR